MPPLGVILSNRKILAERGGFSSTAQAYVVRSARNTPYLYVGMGLS